MERQRLLTLLEELHAELAQTPQLDAELRQAVATLATDAGRLLADEAPGAEASPIAFDAVVSQQLRARLAEFGAEHPQLAKAINQLADGLSNLGI